MTRYRAAALIFLVLAALPLSASAALIQKLNESFVNSDGLRIYYDIHYQNDLRGPIAVVPDSWGGNKDGYTQYARQLAQNSGFIGLAVNTRGKTNSEGSADALGYECRDIYELVEYVRQTYAAYYDGTKGNHIFGFSAGGSKVAVCTGRYPDYFTSGYNTDGVNDLSLWYTIPHATAYESDRSDMRIRTGNSVDPGNVLYHPSGESSENGSVENQEAYDARSGALIGAHNTRTHMYITHYDGDPRVPYALSQAYDSAWRAAGKTQDYDFDTCSGVTHNLCNLTTGLAWLVGHMGIVTMPQTGNLLIGGWVETKKFRIEFLDDVGYMGEVDYALTNSGFTFDISTTSYTGPTEVLFKEPPRSMALYDNGTFIGRLHNGTIQNADADYSITYDGRLRLVLPTMSDHRVEGIALHLLAYSAGAGGSLSGTAEQLVLQGGSGTAVTAVPEEGYRFDRWSDGVGTAWRSDTSVTSGKSVQAVFARIKRVSTTAIPSAVPAPKTSTVRASSSLGNRYLSIGTSGNDVRELQRFLNTNGFVISPEGPGSIGNETAYFGRLTQVALSAFQKKNNIFPAVGYFGPITAERVQSKDIGQ